MHMKNKQYDECHVLNSESFEPYFQPIIDINNDRCIGVEVLARLVRLNILLQVFSQRYWRLMSSKKK